MRRRTLVSTVFTAMTAALVLGVVAVPAGAGIGGVAPLTITKTTVGDVPADAVFVVDVDCTGPIIFDDAGPALSSVELEFGPEGGSTTITFIDGGGCVVTESDDGGADATTLDCAGDVEFCDLGGTNADITIESEVQEVEVIVTNTFPDPPPEVPVDPPAPAAVTQPRFTG